MGIWCIGVVSKRAAKSHVKVWLHLIGRLIVLNRRLRDGTERTDAPFVCIQGLQGFHAQELRFVCGFQVQPNLVKSIQGEFIVGLRATDDLNVFNLEPPLLLLSLRHVLLLVESSSPERHGARAN